MSILGDSIAWALPDLRAAAESTMASYAVVSRLGTPVLNPNTGTETTPRHQVLESECRLRQPTAVESNVLFGEEDVTKLRFIVDFPYDVEGVEVGHEVEFEESSDPEALDRTFKVVALSIRDHNVTRSFGCELVT